MSKLFLLAAFLVLSFQYVVAQNAKPLFSIERNTNANAVYYEAMVDADGLIDSSQPIHAYWVMWEKDPSGKTREELTILEKEKAFGYKVQKGPSRKFIWFTIVAVPTRPIRVSFRNGNPTAEILINGRFSILEKISINSVQRHFLPHVNYIDMFGTDSKTGEGTYERIANK
jgi:hypothetical protein